MTKVFEWLLEHRDEFKCNACGNCCHGVWNPCKRLLEDGRCSIHPTILGEEKRKKLGRKCYPEAEPIEALDFGYYCSPVIEAISRIVGVDLELDSRLSPLGKQVYVIREQMNRVFEMTIGE